MGQYQLGVALPKYDVALIVNSSYPHRGFGGEGAVKVTRFVAAAGGVLVAATLIGFLAWNAR